jgi:hypothetical protein
MSDCVIRDSHRGVSVRLSLGGSIVRALFSNMIIETKIFDSMWWGRGEPIQVEAVRWDAGSDLGVVKDIRFSNLICTPRTAPWSGRTSPGHIENISFDRVSIHIVRPVEHFPGGQQDLRPTANEGLPEMPTERLHPAPGGQRQPSRTARSPGARTPRTTSHMLLDAAASPGLADAGLRATPRTRDAAKLIR